MDPHLGGLRGPDLDPAEPGMDPALRLVDLVLLHPVALVARVGLVVHVGLAALADQVLEGREA